MAIVSIQKTERYEEVLLDRAVSAHFEALGIAGDLNPGMHVVIKPNLLAARSPDLAVTTHPAVLSAIGGSCDGDEFDRMEQLEKRTGVQIPKNLADLRQKPQLHNAVIDKEQMLSFVLGL